MPVILRRISTVYQPQRVYKWRVTIQPSKIGSSGGNFVAGLPPESIVDCSLPFIANENEGIHQGGTNDYYPNFVDIGNLSLTFIENQEGLVMKSLDAWKRLVQAPNELFNYPVNYKRVVECELLDNANEVHSKTKLLGVWPSTTSPENLDYNTSDVWRISQEFSVDGAEILGV